MSYVIQARLSNAQHPENGSNEILFPLSREDYPGEIQRLGELQAGDPVKQDCKVEEIDSFYEVLQCLKGQVVNVDELDYLAKRLESFDEYEAVQFQAACSALGCRDIMDLINLTFCSDQATVISDFSKLEEAGKEHYLTIHGGSAPVNELAGVDGKALARRLIQSGKGKPTPYGLFFLNQMQIEDQYSGQGFPPYLWDERTAELEIIKPDKTKTFFFLPFAPLEFERFQQREGISDVSACKCILRLYQRQENYIVVRGGTAELEKWNELCDTLNSIPYPRQQAFAAALEVTDAEDVSQMRLLAASLEDFDLVPGVRDAQSYGKYMIQESGKYRYDPDLECYYNYEALGEFLMTHEAGQITSQGYLKCEEGSAFLDLFIQESLTPTQEHNSADMGGTMQMGEMQ